MASRTSWEGYLKLNLLSVPVKAYNAASSGGGKIGFHLIHTKCHERIRYKKVCPTHGEVPNDEIVSAYPTLSLSDVYAALAYYFENRERIDADIEAGKTFAEELRARSGPSRLQERLKAREAHGSNDPLPPR